MVKVTASFDPLPTAYDRAMERTAHIEPADPNLLQSLANGSKGKPLEPAPVVPMTFEAWWQRWYEHRSEPEIWNAEDHRDDFETGWNAAVTACAITAQWEFDSKKYKYRECGPTGEEVATVIRELEVK